MAKLLKNFLTRRVLGHRHNLVSTGSHYQAMATLLAGHRVQGLLDAGASDGRITRKLLRTFPDAAAFLFEPHPDYRQVLEVYRQSDRRVHPQFVALADHRGELTLTLNQQRGMTSMFATSALSRRLFPEGSATSPRSRCRSPPSMRGGPIAEIRRWS